MTACSVRSCCSFSLGWGPRVRPARVAGARRATPRHAPLPRRVTAAAMGAHGAIAHAREVFSSRTTSGEARPLERPSPLGYTATPTGVGAGIPTPSDRVRVPRTGVPPGTLAAARVVRDTTSGPVIPRTKAGTVTHRRPQPPAEANAALWTGRVVVTAAIRTVPRPARLPGRPDTTTADAILALAPCTTQIPPSPAVRPPPRPRVMKRPRRRKGLEVTRNASKGAVPPPGQSKGLTVASGALGAP